jgi:hypothetical protein
MRIGRGRIVGRHSTCDHPRQFDCYHRTMRIMCLHVADHPLLRHGTVL